MTALTLNAEPQVLIDWFDDFEGANDYSFLSNFYLGEPIVMGDGIEYPTGEAAFQAQKVNTRSIRMAIAHGSSPHVAKRIGRTVQLRSDWELIKYDVMADVLRRKFRGDRLETELLLSTGSAYLVEGTFWNDRVWGVDLTDPAWPGRNWLGTLLMARRAELNAIQLGASPPDVAYANHRFSTSTVRP